MAERKIEKWTTRAAVSVIEQQPMDGWREVSHVEELIADAYANRTVSAPSEYEEKMTCGHEKRYLYGRSPCGSSLHCCICDIQAAGRDSVSASSAPESEGWAGDPLWPLYQEYASMVPPKGECLMTYSGWLRRLAERIRAERNTPAQALPVPPATEAQ